MVTNKSPPQVNATDTNFHLTQLSIADTQSKGIAVRERNQILADELGSLSAMGLAQVAQMQVAAMIDVQDLKQEDVGMLEKLVKNVERAMSSNGVNLNMVESECRA